MKANTTDEVLEVVQAFKDKVIIECTPLYSSHHKFAVATTPCWDFKNFFYRVKEVSLEMWVNVTKEGTKYNHASKRSAQFAADRSSSYARIAVHMKEVE